MNAQEASAGEFKPQSVSDIFADRMQDDANPAMQAMLEQVEAMLETASSLPEFRERLMTTYPDLDSTELATVMGQAMMAAHAGGRAALEEESG